MVFVITLKFAYKLLNNFDLGTFAVAPKKVILLLLEIGFAKLEAVFLSLVVLWVTHQTFNYLWLHRIIIIWSHNQIIYFQDNQNFIFLNYLELSIS